MTEERARLAARGEARESRASPERAKSLLAASWAAPQVQTSAVFLDLGENGRAAADKPCRGQSEIVDPVFVFQVAGCLQCTQHSRGLECKAQRDKRKAVVELFVELCLMDACFHIVCLLRSKIAMHPTPQIYCIICVLRVWLTVFPQAFVVSSRPVRVQTLAVLVDTQVCQSLI